MVSVGTSHVTGVSESTVTCIYCHTVCSEKVFIFIDDITVEHVADQSKEQTKSKDVAGVLEAVGH